MLSILIPIYNHDVNILVRELAAQGQRSGIPFEILCYDDHSTLAYKELNRPLANLVGVAYIELKKNNGRSKIRNKLGFYARYDHLLFLDGDGEVRNPNFIKNYMDHVIKHEFIYGGTTYPDTPPEDPNKMLRWVYGTKIEALPYHKRLKHPQHFTSNNFAIHRDIFLSVKFDETIEGYGYEDLVFAQDIEKAGYSIFQIDNPLHHEDIDTNKQYIAKLESALRNLALLDHNKRIYSTKITNAYQWLIDYQLLGIFQKLMSWKKVMVMKNMNGLKPSMFILNMWKLYIYSGFRTDLALKSSTETKNK